MKLVLTSYSTFFFHYKQYHTGTVIEYHNSGIAALGYKWLKSLILITYRSLRDDL